MVCMLCQTVQPLSHGHTPHKSKAITETAITSAIAVFIQFNVNSRSRCFGPGYNPPGNVPDYLLPPCPPDRANGCHHNMKVSAAAVVAKGGSQVSVNLAIIGAFISVLMTIVAESLHLVDDSAKR